MEARFDGLLFTFTCTSHRVPTIFCYMVYILMVQIYSIAFDSQLVAGLEVEPCLVLGWAVAASPSPGFGLSFQAVTSPH